MAAPGYPAREEENAERARRAPEGERTIDGRARSISQSLGLPPGKRYRCAACGNLTRFDVESVERVSRYWHVDLAGNGIVEEEARPEVSLIAVTCRWCGAGDAVEVVDAPAGQTGLNPATPPGGPGGLNSPTSQGRRR